MKLIKLNAWNRIQNEEICRSHEKNIVSRGEWLGNPANFKVENNSAVVYVWIN